MGRIDCIKEESRAARGTALIESVLQDVRYAWRGVRANAAFSAGVILALALGIGANTAMFGILDRLLLRPPAYLSEADRVHRVYLTWTADRDQRIERFTSIARYLDFARWTRTLSAVVAFGAAAHRRRRWRWGA